jgi:hypothetical protein
VECGGSPPLFAARACPGVLRYSALRAWFYRRAVKIPGADPWRRSATAASDLGLATFNPF